MIGLSPWGSKLYRQLRARYELIGIPLSDETIRDTVSFSQSDTTRLLSQLSQRGFIVLDRTGRIIPNPPPHETVMAQVCAAMNLSVEDITGPSHDSRLVRARRAIAKKLREHRYSARHIARVINRHQTTIEEYSKPQYSAQRAKRRSLALYGERLAA